jgi:hypothetical protein
MNEPLYVGIMHFIRQNIPMPRRLSKLLYVWAYCTMDENMVTARAIWQRWT